ncbi:hypothetical protein D3C74_374290 [compost metagenome]
MDRQKPDRTEAGHKQPVRRAYLTANHRVHPYRHRLKQSALLKAHLLRQLEQKVAANRHIFRPGTIHRRCCHKHHVRAQIITTGFTIFAAAAGYTRLHGYPVANGYVGDLISNLHHLTCQLMTKNNRLFYYITSDPSVLIIMNIRSANADTIHFD